jgi:ubiquitin carboxyl-terminal hydrolase 10
MLSTANFCKHGRQEDAEEFLSYLLNTLDNEMLEVMRFSNDNSPKMDNNINNSEWNVVKSKKKKNKPCSQLVKIKRTPLSNIFQGQLRSRISRQGQQATDNVEPFFTLQLDVHVSISTILMNLD